MKKGVLLVMKDDNQTSMARNWPIGGARGVMVTVVGNVHGDTISNPGPD